MSEEQLKELQEYNLEYLEAQNSEEIFGGDYTSAVELKYAELKIEEMKKELINQDMYISKLKEEYAKKLQQKENIIKEVREYITSYEAISTIQGLEDIEANKDLDEKTLNEMVRRYMIVHDKLLEILDKENQDE